MADTAVLGMETANYAATQKGYAERVEDDRIENANRDKVDAWAGAVTGSFQSVFYVSGALGTHLGNSETYGGIAVAQEHRVITEVSLVCATTGTADVTTVDVLRQETAGSTPTTIFVTDDVRPYISASKDATNTWDVASTATISGSAWDKGRVLIVNVKEVATGASDAAVIVHWKPSASYA